MGLRLRFLPEYKGVTGTDSLIVLCFLVGSGGRRRPPLPFVVSRVV